MKQRAVLCLAVAALLATVAWAAPYPAFYINSFENPGDVPPPPSDDVTLVVAKAL